MPNSRWSPKRYANRVFNYNRARNFFVICSQERKMEELGIPVPTQRASRLKHQKKGSIHWIHSTLWYVEHNLVGEVWVRPQLFAATQSQTTLTAFSRPRQKQRCYQRHALVPLGRPLMRPCGWRRGSSRVNRVFLQAGALGPIVFWAKLQNFPKKPHFFSFETPPQPSTFMTSSGLDCVGFGGLCSHLVPFGAACLVAWGLTPHEFQGSPRVSQVSFFQADLLHFG